MPELRRRVNRLRFQLRRLRDARLGEDVANFERLVRQGRIVYGTASYGVPKVVAFEYSTDRLIVGAYSSLNGTYLLAGNHPVRHVTTYPLRINYGLPGAGKDGCPEPNGDINVGSDVWSGFGSLIMGGVTIGDGAVVAGGAVVVKDVPPYAIVAGNPAKVIKYRHTEEQRAALLDIKWWDWPHEEVMKAVPYLASEDIDAFIEYARNRDAT